MSDNFVKTLKDGMTGVYGNMGSYIFIIEHSEMMA